MSDHESVNKQKLDIHQNVIERLKSMHSELCAQVRLADEQLDRYQPGSSEYTAWFKLLSHFNRAALQVFGELEQLWGAS